MLSMKLNDYMLGAYQKASDGDAGEPDAKGKEARPQPFIHKPIFEKVNSRVGEILGQQEAERKNLEEAKIAAKTGIWYGKSVSRPTDADVKQAARTLTEGALIKVPEKPREADGRESIYRRVAKFLVIIGVDEAAKILPQLSEDQIEKIVPEIAAVQSVPKEEADQILEEFQSLLDKAREGGGIDTARTILTKAYGEKKGEEILGRAVQYPNGKPFDFLSEASADRIGVLLNGESEQVQALVLSQLEPKKAAAILRDMDDRTKGAIVIRLVKMKNVAPQLMESVGRSLTNADDRYLQNKLHDMDDKTIAILIKGKKADFREKILSNLSKRRAESVLDEESLTEFLLKSESERVTSQFFADLRRAWEAGELHVKGRDDNEIWVQ